MSQHENSIPELSVGAVVEELTGLYVAAIKAGVPFTNIPAPFLWGAPGVGKSDGVKQLAKGIEYETGKRVVVTDVRLLLFSPIDLRGVPVADVNREFTEWLKPKIFDLDGSEEVVNILFLDELSAAPQSVQAAAYQITLNRTIGEHALPANCIVIAAGNRTSDRSVAYRMPNALANRLCHFQVSVDFESWRSWAILNNVHPDVLGYLSYDNSKLIIEEVELDQVAFPTPRSWMFVSGILNTLTEKVEVADCYALLAGCIGMGTALEFIAWCKSKKDLPPVEEIFQGKVLKYPATQDALYAMISSIATYAFKREQLSARESLTISELENVVRYAMKFPTDYQMCLLVKLCTRQSLKDKLLKIENFRIWMKQGNHQKVLFE